MKPGPASLVFDKYTLDDELEKIGDEIFQWCKVLADKEERLRELEDQKELVEAELKTKIRARPKRFGCLKLTEPSIKETMIQQPEYQGVKSRIRLVRKKVDYLKAYIKGLEAKKRALEKTVDLHGQSYFSKPMTKRTREMMNEIEKGNARRKMQRGVEE